MKFYRLSDATFYDRINNIYQFIKPFWIKISIFEEYAATENGSTLKRQSLLRGANSFFLE